MHLKTEIKSCAFGIYLFWSMSVAIAAVDDAPVAVEIADVVDCVLSYLFIIQFNKMRGSL